MQFKSLVVGVIAMGTTVEAYLIDEILEAAAGRDDLDDEVECAFLDAQPGLHLRDSKGVSKHWYLFAHPLNTVKGVSKHFGQKR